MPEQPERRADAALTDHDTAAGGEHRDVDHGRHPAGQPAFCPGCAYPIGDDLSSLVVEFWEADRRVYRVSCASCRWTGEISQLTRAHNHDPDD